MTRSPWYSRLALVLALLLPVYFAVAALGTKFGLWSWQTSWEVSYDEYGGGNEL